MKRVVNKLANSKFEVLVTVEEKEWKEAQEKAFEKLAKKVKISGFREGKVPLEMARKHVNQADIFNEAINAQVQPAFDEVMKEEKLVPVARPTVDVSKVSETELELKFVIVTNPEVKLGKYTGLNIAKETPVVTEEEIDEAIKTLIEQNASLVAVERESKLGDTVVIDFEGFVDGVAFDGGKAENYSLALGSNSFVPGFEDQLVGKKSGDEVEVKVTFPKQYVENLAGKDATFKVKVHEVKEKVLPELDAELIKELNIPNVETVEQLREHEKGHLLSHKEEHAKADVLNKVLDKIVDASELEIAEEIVHDEVENMRKNMAERIAQQGLTMEQYLQITGQKQEDVDKKFHEDAEKNLRAMFVLEEIAKKENLSVTEEEVEFEIAKIADQYKMEVAKVKEILNNQLAQFRGELRQRKIQDFLFEKNVK